MPNKVAGSYSPVWLSNNFTPGFSLVHWPKDVFQVSSNTNTVIFPQLTIFHVGLAIHTACRQTSITIKSNLCIPQLTLQTSSLPSECIQGLSKQLCSLVPLQ